MFAGVENIHFWIIHSSSVGYHPFKDPPPPNLVYVACVCKGRENPEGRRRRKKKRVVFQPWNISSSAFCSESACDLIVEVCREVKQRGSTVGWRAASTHGQHEEWWELWF